MWKVIHRKKNGDRLWYDEQADQYAVSDGTHPAQTEIGGAGRGPYLVDIEHMKKEGRIVFELPGEGNKLSMYSYVKGVHFLVPLGIGAAALLANRLSLPLVLTWEGLTFSLSVDDVKAQLATA